MKEFLTWKEREEEDETKHNILHFNTDVAIRHYFVCCRSGKFETNEAPRKTKEKRCHQKETRKLNSTCISRIYVNVKDDGQILSQMVLVVIQKQ